MIKYYNLYRRLGRVDGKYAHEATMDWMNPNYKVLSFDQINSFLLNLTFPNFVFQLIEIFKEDTISFEGLALCLKLEMEDTKAKGVLVFSDLTIQCEVLPDEQVRNTQVKEFTMKILQPAVFSEFQSMQNSTSFVLDEDYRLDIALKKGNDDVISAIILKHS